MGKLCVIPARGGSKGVPNKNIKLLNGKPLIAYTIGAALESKLFTEVIVSTDSDRIAKIACEYGASVPFIRPEELSGDSVASDDVVYHAINFFHDQGKEFDVVCKLQPTSPLRSALHICEAYNLLERNNANYVVSVCECEHSPLWSGTIERDLRLDDFISPLAKETCRQNLPVYYRLNGAIYMGKTESFKIEKNFLGKNSLAYIMAQDFSIDIDSEIDFLLANFLIKQKK